MQDSGELKPGRDIFITLGVCAIAAASIFSAPGPAFPVLHTMLNTGIALVTVVLSLLFWDLGWRTGNSLVRFMAIVFAVAGFLEVLHVLAALEPASASEGLNEVWRRLRSGTWAPPAYLLPLGLGFLLLVGPPPRTSKTVFALGDHRGRRRLVRAVPVAAALRVAGLAGNHPADAGGRCRCCGSRSALMFWRRRRGDRIAQALAFYAFGTGLAHLFMLYSDEATSKFAMTAHFGVFGAGLYLLLSLVQMGTADTARRMRVNEELEARVAARTAQLEGLNADLRREVGVRHGAEVRTLMQLERLDLLRRITHAIGERQDLASIIQVVVRSVEEDLPADFVAICDYLRDTTGRDAGSLVVKRVGTRSQALALELAMTERARIAIDQNGLARCVSGQQVYEADISSSNFPFPSRLAQAGLNSMVIVPLMVEQAAACSRCSWSRAARPMPSAVASANSCASSATRWPLAANQAQLHDSLQQAYEDLKRTQEAVLRAGAAACARADGQRHRARHQQRHLAGGALRRVAADLRKRIQRARPQAAARSSSAPWTTWRARWHAWASSIGAVPRSSSWRRCASSACCARCST